MLKPQLEILRLWYRAGEAMRDLHAASVREDRGEVTAQTALIVLLVAAAIAAGTAIALVMANNTSNIPSP